MQRSEIVEAFCLLGNKFQQLYESNDERFFLPIYHQNPWFIDVFVKYSLKQWASELTSEKINHWLGAYPLKPNTQKKVGIVMAGNIPMVGLHDLLSVLAAGHSAIIKPSQKDTLLIQFAVESLWNIHPGFKSRIKIENGILKTFDAIIATGSNNTNRYFSYYFRNKPNLLRCSRTSVAVITADWNAVDYQQLAEDIFVYFGLGCRNVNKVFIPDSAIKNCLNGIQTEIEKFKFLAENSRYFNNYQYQKSILLLDKKTFYDSGFSLITESQLYNAPPSVIYFEKYENLNDIKKKLESTKDQIQCIVAKGNLGFVTVEPGSTQKPKLTDYADGVDTMAFLNSIK